MGIFTRKKKLGTTLSGSDLCPFYVKPHYNNWSGNKYAERLVSEWMKYGSIILAVDFDDTLSEWGFKQEQDHKMFQETIDLILFAQTLGCYVVIFTACAPDRYEFIKEYCLSRGLAIDSINENPIDLPYGKTKKIYYNWNLCDRSGLEQALDILNYSCWRVQSERKPKTTNFDV